MKLDRPVISLTAALTVAFLLATPAMGQTTLTATLTGPAERPNPGDPDGYGFATVTLDPASGTVRYSLVAREIVAPSAAHIHRGTADVAGDVVVNFAPSFANGVATGTVMASASLIEEILADPAAFYVNIHNVEYPGGAIRGQLTASSLDGTAIIFPVAGSLAGANETFFRTDLALVNEVEAPTTVTLEYYASSAGGGSAPTATAVIDLNTREQVQLFDVVRDTFGMVSSSGAIRLFAPHRVTAIGRIYNDQRAVGGGTYGQFVPAHPEAFNRTTGTFPMLSNQQTGNFRANIGWFNDGNETVTVHFEARPSSGIGVESVNLEVPPKSQLQMQLNQLFPDLGPHESMYVTFIANAPLYVYASIVDNRTGDAIFVPAQ